MIQPWGHLGLFAIVVAAWSWFASDEIARQALTQVYAPLRSPDALALVLMVPVAESVLGIRRIIRDASGAASAARVSQVLAATPTLSLLFALRPLLAHAYQNVPTSMSFDTFGTLLTIVVGLVTFGIPASLRALLPERDWRLELCLLLHLFVLAAVTVGYAWVTMGPLPPSDASISWRGTGVLVFGGLVVATTAACLGPRIARWRTTRGWLRTDMAAEAERET